ncbi:hypothetical protein AX16_007028 [Volvariella volvacea WC 439]|nr:hypothetical protein AX16_007028 [Volvariella volvacea WC 439]
MSSQHLQHHHQQQAQPQYVHYTGPPGAQLHPQVIHHQPSPVIAQQQPLQQQAQQQPQAQQHQPHHHQAQQQTTPQVAQSAPAPAVQQQPQQQQQGTGQAPLVATGDWTKDLVHLAKTAELKKHALTLQLQTAHILSAHATLDAKKKIMQDIKEQKNKLESERMRLLQCLAQADLQQNQVEKECRELQAKIDQLTEGEYATAKRDVDRLRQELGQPPLPSLQATLEEKTAQYLNERRLNGNGNGNGNDTQATAVKRASEGSGHIEGQPVPGKRPRGRPKGSKNRVKTATGVPGPGPGASVSAPPGT